MKFSDLFIPRWRHSDPQVRQKAVEKLKDANLLAQIAEKDEYDNVREAARQRLVALQAA